MAITNGIFLGDIALLKFFGEFEWLEERRRLEFDFDAIAVLGLKFNLPKGGAESLGAATGLGAENNVKRAEQGKKAFFVRGMRNSAHPRKHACTSTPSALPWLLTAHTRFPLTYTPCAHLGSAELDQCR